MSRRRILAASLTVVLLTASLTGAVLWHNDMNRYGVRVVMDSAVGVIDGTPVQIDGRNAGEVTAVEARDNKAIVTLSMDSDHAPLPAGSKPQVEWRSLLGERFVAIKPGPKENPAIPAGAMIDSGNPQVTPEDLLETLDPPTRRHVKGLVSGLNQTLDGREKDLNATLKTAGPSIDAMGSVLSAVGSDGPAIRELVTNMHGVSKVLAGRQHKLSGVVNDLGKVTRETAGKQRQFNDGLKELPSTLTAADGTFKKVPKAVDSLNPLLRDLKPATERLPSVTRNLRPLMRDLRPTIGRLRPTLQATNKLFNYTPQLLNSAHATLPEVTQATRTLAPAVAFLRPYTPEAVAFVGQFGNVFSQYDSQGHFAHTLITADRAAVDNSPPLQLPDMKFDTRRTPGANAGQPWKDANGSAPR